MLGLSGCPISMIRGKSEWGHWFNLRESNCQQERLVPVINSEFKVPQDLAFTNNCLTKLNHSKTTPAVITTTINPLVSPH